MSDTQVCCRYDGSFAGFLCCVFDCYVNHWEPVEFFSDWDERLSLYPEQTVSTRRAEALRVYRSLADRLGPAGQRLAARGFLTCLEERELWLWRFIRKGYRQGPSVVRELTDPTVDQILRAVRNLEHEAHSLKGFVRFSQLGEALVGEIEPKNQVLPLLRPHFCSRYPQESFALYDRTHRKILLHQPAKWAILPAEDFQGGTPSEQELYFRRLWRSFYHTISIQARYNPKCRMTHMPKRYWTTMTEFQEDSGVSLPPTGHEKTGPQSGPIHKVFPSTPPVSDASSHRDTDGPIPSGSHRNRSAIQY